MIIKKTVLILGAGASVDYGFPLGRRLITQICEELAYKSDLYNLLNDCGSNEQQIEKFQSQLAASNLPSIDAFLENRPEFEKVGKMAIAATLIPHEKYVHLTRDKDRYFWYEYLHGKIIQRKADFSCNKLSIVTFNYDRSFEAALFRAVQNAYGLTDDECGEYMKAIPVIHVYGKLGEPGWLTRQGRPYTPDMTPQIVFDSAQSIKIVHEGAEDAPEINMARQAIKDAEVVCCLGFGYHPTNVSRLQLSGLLHDKRVFFSAYGFTQAEINAINVSLFPNGFTGTSYPVFGKSDQKILSFLRETNALGQ